MTTGNCFGSTGASIQLESTFRSHGVQQIMSAAREFYVLKELPVAAVEELACFYEQKDCGDVAEFIRGARKLCGEMQQTFDLENGWADQAEFAREVCRTHEQGSLTATPSQPGTVTRNLYDPSGMSEKLQSTLVAWGALRLKENIRDLDLLAEMDHADREELAHCLDEKYRGTADLILEIDKMYEEFCREIA